MDKVTEASEEMRESPGDGADSMPSRPAASGASAGKCRPTRMETEAAVRTLIRWVGDDPTREGLRDTPARVVRAYEEWFSGYRQDPVALLERMFDETAGYDGPIELRHVSFHSFCERYMAPIRGKAHVAYLPTGRVVGISKLARVIDACAARAQTQERLTDDIAIAIEAALRPRGVAVVIEAEHADMTAHPGAAGTRLVTKRMLGAFRDDAGLRWEFLGSLGLR